MIIYKDMKHYLRVLIVFLYICLAFIINPNKALADSTYYLNAINTVSISQQKSEITDIKTNENYSAVLRNNSNSARIKNSSNKNNTQSSPQNSENAVLNNIQRYYTHFENIVIPICISHNISPNLKNAIYTRAP